MIRLQLLTGLPSSTVKMEALMSDELMQERGKEEGGLERRMIDTCDKGNMLSHHHTQSLFKPEASCRLRASSLLKDLAHTHTHTIL